VAELNSEKRAMKLEKEIEKRLGASAFHLSTRARTPAEILENSPEREARKANPGDVELEEVLLDPEVRKRAQEVLQKEVEAWVHRKIPVLGGRTPLQAVRDADGREMVEALLLMFGRRAKDESFGNGIRPDIGAVRRLLNLSSSAS
jgi:hypothetical protein